MKKLVSNHQYSLATNTLEEIDTLVKLLKERGYEIHHNLENVLTFDRVPVGICVDNGLDDTNGGKCVFQSNVTGMASFCFCYHTKPLYVKEVIDNITKLIDELDIEFYNELLEKGSKEAERPSGTILCFKQTTRK